MPPHFRSIVIGQPFVSKERPLFFADGTPLGPYARTSCPCGVATATDRLRPLAVRGIGFAPEMIAPFAIMPHLQFPGLGKRMAVYLISLALAGLVALALWDGLS